MKDFRVSIIRPPNASNYVSVDDLGFPRTVPNWEAAVELLTTLSSEDPTEIEARRPAVDEGKIQYLPKAGYTD